MRKVKSLLETLTANYPPGDGQRHSVHIGANGDLNIVLFLGEHYQPLIMYNEDLDKSVEQVIAEIDMILPSWCKEPDLNKRKPPGIEA